MNDESQATAPEWTENRASRGGRALDWRELVDHRDVTWFLAGRDLKIRYKQAFFGAAWSIVQPVVGALVLTIVFRKVADVSSDGIAYVPFAMLGYAGWTLFTRGVNGATQSLVANAALITKVYFPRLLLPIAAVLPCLVDFAVALVPVAIAMVITVTVPTVALLTLPVWVALIAVVALGIGLGFATINVRYRDAGPVLGLITQMLFFLSPVAYPASALNGRWAWLYYLNPMAGLLEGLRWSTLGGPWPGAGLVLSLLTGAVMVVVGLGAFRRGERQFADVI
ncbi:MAG: ABC transporter permease [Ilumatobacteraceae bacterium]